jgi:hypothetical protein
MSRKSRNSAWLLAVAEVQQSIKIRPPSPVCLIVSPVFIRWTQVVTETRTESGFSAPEGRKTVAQTSEAVCQELFLGRITVLEQNFPQSGPVRQLVA